MIQDWPRVLGRWLSPLTGNPGQLALVAGVIALLTYTAFRVGLRFLLNRLAGLMFVLLSVTFITFLLGYLTPGTPVQVLCGQHCTPDSIVHLEHLYHLDLPWYAQYGAFLNGLLHLDLGNSITHPGYSVGGLLATRVPVSAELGLLGLGVQLLVAVPWGVLSALRAGSRFDTISTTVAFIMASLPPFVVIPLYQFGMVVLARQGIPHLPVAGWGQPIDLIAPLALFILGSGYLMRLTRTTLLDTLSEDYVRTARAKGLPERVVIYRHALRNSLGPLLTVIGLSVAFVVGGALFIETLFNIPGIGYYAVQSVYEDKDMPVVQGITLLVAVSVTTMNSVIDVLQAMLDPRIKLQ